jgi:hypothetical protein
MTQTHDDASLEQQPAPSGAAAAPGAGELVARPDRAYRWKHLIMALVLIGGGALFAYDGWVRWPAQNVRAADLERRHAAETDPARKDQLSRELREVSKHTDLDILFQKVLAFVLPLAGLFWGAWTLRDTRGVYRMTGAGTLHVPGHPSITLADIRRIDKRKWDRKGVAYLHYEQEGAGGVAKLDDFAYDREPTDAMLDRIEKSLLGTPDAAPPPAAT